MLLINVHLKVALDLAHGPFMEKFEVKDIDELKYIFRYFPDITFEDDKILKNGVPVGTILDGSMSDG